MDNCTLPELPGFVANSETAQSMVPANRNFIAVRRLALVKDVPRVLKAKTRRRSRPRKPKADKI